MPDSLFEAEREEAHRRADELRVKAKAEADRQDRVRAERIKLAKAEQERAKVTRREEREKGALERRESRDLLDHRSSLSNGSARPAPTPLDDSWRSDPELWKEGGKILPWQTKGHDPPPGFVAPADWNPVGWKYVSGVWVNIPKVKAQQAANATSGGYSQRDSERAMKAEAKARVKAESDRARARAEMIAREREAGRRAADHISTVGAKVIPSRVADQPSSRALSITESKLSNRGTSTSGVLPNMNFIMLFQRKRQLSHLRLRMSQAILPCPLRKQRQGQVLIALQPCLRRLYNPHCIRAKCSSSENKVFLGQIQLPLNPNRPSLVVINHRHPWNPPHLCLVLPQVENLQFRSPIRMDVTGRHLAFQRSTGQAICSLNSRRRLLISLVTTSLAVRRSQFHG